MYFGMIAMCGAVQELVFIKLEDLQKEKNAVLVRSCLSDTKAPL
jgi:hypothetical protein